jgi:hypothetical protein
VEKTSSQVCWTCEVSSDRRGYDKHPKEKKEKKYKRRTSVSVVRKGYEKEKETV